MSNSNFFTLISHLLHVDMDIISLFLFSLLSNNLLSKNLLSKSYQHFNCMVSSIFVFFIFPLMLPPPPNYRQISLCITSPF